MSQNSELFSLFFEILKVWTVLELIEQTTCDMNITVVFSSIWAANAPDRNVAMRDKYTGYFQTQETHHEAQLKEVCDHSPTAAEFLSCPPHKVLPGKQDLGLLISKPSLSVWNKEAVCF